MSLEGVKCLVIGFGSIGRRHESVLRELGAETAVVSLHADNLDIPCFSSVEEALSLYSPEYVVISNRTAEHVKTLEQLALLGFKGRCLVEKPLAGELFQCREVYGFSIMVGYVMRFHPLVRRALAILGGKRLLSIQSYVGQYLPDWRPGTDYRQCYSASKAQGGGALRDLSHELDYLLMLGGVWERVCALGGHFSELEIDSDDVFGLLFQTNQCPLVLCQVNYLDRNTRRDCSIQYEGGTLYLDFIKNQLTHNGHVECFELERNEMFAAMHHAALENDDQELCSFHEAYQVLELITAAEQSVEKEEWVCRKDH